MQKSYLSVFVLASYIWLGGCQVDPKAAATASTGAKTENGAGQICTANGKGFEDEGPAQNAPVVLADGSKSWVGAGIKVSLMTALNDAGSEGVKAKVLGGSNKGKIVTFKSIHLECPDKANAQTSQAGQPSKSTSQTSGSIEDGVPWSPYYACVVKSSSDANAAFKGTDGTITNVGNGYRVAVPSGEISNITVNVYVLKGGVVAAGTRGSMQKADLSDCVEDKSI